MPSRHIFLLLMAAMLLGRTLHCCAVEATLCGAAAAEDAAAGDEHGSPLRNPDDTDPNETGCICKGALLRAPAVLEAVQSALEGYNPLALALHSPALLPVDPADCRPVERHLLGPPLLGGMALRTWIGSLLI